MLSKIWNKAKDFAFCVVSFPFVLLSSVVIHHSGLDRVDSWPSVEEMKKQTEGVND